MPIHLELSAAFCPAALLSSGSPCFWRVSHLANSRVSKVTTSQLAFVARCSGVTWTLPCQRHHLGTPAWMGKVRKGIKQTRMWPSRQGHAASRGCSGISFGGIFYTQAKWQAMRGPCLVAAVTGLSLDCRVMATISRLNSLTLLKNHWNTRQSSITHFLIIITRESLLISRINVTNARYLKWVSLICVTWSE